MCLQGQEGPGGLRPAVVRAWLCGCNCSGIAGSHLTTLSLGFLIRKNEMQWCTPRGLL